MGGRGSVHPRRGGITRAGGRGDEGTLVPVGEEGEERYGTPGARQLDRSHRPVIRKRRPLSGAPATFA
jgi:hypothetical protein